MTACTRLLLVVAAVCAVGATQAPNQQRVGKTFDATIAVIADGDTLELIPAGEQQRIRIRLEGIDAPELGEVFSREAQMFMRGLLLNQRVRVDGRDVDRYGRLVARVSANGKDASTELLRAGLACHRYARDGALASAESAARSAGAGFWAAAATKPRCVGLTQPNSSRHATSLTSLRGNTSSRLYHAPGCPNYSCKNCTRVFATEAEARAAGFKPSPDCARR
ncbi:MAG TPA: thermonuclease family protein [Vicinamibacterales bacterium]|nr:thermonuclease family protein [Vicinamibacterales bacterium]